LTWCFNSCNTSVLAWAVPRKICIKSKGTVSRDGSCFLHKLLVLCLHKGLGRFLNFSDAIFSICLLYILLRLTQIWAGLKMLTACIWSMFPGFLLVNWRFRPLPDTSYFLCSNSNYIIRLHARVMQLYSNKCLPHNIVGIWSIHRCSSFPDVKNNNGTAAHILSVICVAAQRSTDELQENKRQLC
jgi:hypothetical protein